MRPARDKKLVITSRGKMPEDPISPEPETKPPNRRLAF
jgi:hypothetical protein